MKKMNITIQQVLVLAMLLCLQWSCSDDEQEPAITYVDYEVEFFLQHPNVTYIPPVFEEETLTFLTRQEHREGAVFNTVSMSVAVRDESRTYSTYNEENVELVTNLETGDTTSIVCREFFNFGDIDPNIRPAEFRTVVKEELVTNGTGAIQPAEFVSFSALRRISDGEIINVNTPNRIGVFVDFRVPSTMSRADLRDYIESELAALGSTVCQEGNGFIIQQ